MQTDRLAFLHALQVQGLSLREMGAVVGLSRTRVMGLLQPPLYYRRRLASLRKRRCQRCQAPIIRGAHYHREAGPGFSPLKEVEYLCPACHQGAHDGA